MYVRLEDERGNPLRDLSDQERVTATITGLRPGEDDEGSICWRFIDLYGDTTFNRLQMRPFLAELDRLRVRAKPEDDRVLEAIRDLATQCQSSAHRYLKFYGD